MRISSPLLIDTPFKRILDAKLTGNYKRINIFLDVICVIYFYFYVSLLSKISLKVNLVIRASSGQVSV